MNKNDESKQEPTTGYVEKALIWARDSRLTLTMDVDSDRDGKRQFIAMLRPWKQDKDRPYMWWYCHESIDEAVCGVIDKCCLKNKHQDLNFGYRPWNPTGNTVSAERVSPFAR